MMPMLRVFSKGTVLAMFIYSGKKGGGRTASFFQPLSISALPSIMGKSAIGLCHTMGIFLLLYSRAAIAGRID